MKRDEELLTINKLYGPHGSWNLSILSNWLLENITLRIKAIPRPVQAERISIEWDFWQPIYSTIHEAYASCFNREYASPDKIWKWIWKVALRHVNGLGLKQELTDLNSCSFLNWLKQGCSSIPISKKHGLP